MKLTKNLNRSEAFDWHKHHGVFGTNLKNLKQWQKEDHTPTVEANIKAIAEEVQIIRNEVNKAFPEFKGQIGLKITSWFRPVKWERLRGRTGSSQHVTGNAVDFIAVNIPSNKVVEAMDWIWEYLNKGPGWKGGLARLYKNKTYGFIHIDLGRKRRWEY
jgi:hypothetical protein